MNQGKRGQRVIYDQATGEPHLATFTSCDAYGVHLEVLGKPCTVSRETWDRMKTPIIKGRVYPERSRAIFQGHLQAGGGLSWAAQLRYDGDLEAVESRWGRSFKKNFKAGDLVDTTYGSRFRVLEVRDNEMIVEDHAKRRLRVVSTVPRDNGKWALGWGADLDDVGLTTDPSKFIEKYSGEPPCHCVHPATGHAAGCEWHKWWKAKKES